VHYIQQSANEDSVWTTLGGNFILDSTPVGLPVGYNYSVKKVGVTTLTVGGTTVSIDTFYTTEDVTISFDTYYYLDSLELIPVVLPDGRVGFSEHTYDPGQYNGVRFKTFHSAYFPGEGSVCLEPDGEQIFQQRFGDGIGLLYELDSAGPEAHASWEAVYFQKGLITWGTPFDFEALGVVTVEPSPAAVDWQVYPNPADHVMHVQGLVADATTLLELFDAAGRRIVHQTGRASIDVSTLENGVYLLLLEHRGISTRRQIMVQH
jgi:hypothetical protein